MTLPSLWTESCSFLSGVFLFFIFGCVLLSKKVCCVLIFSVDIFVFQVISIKPEIGFQKTNLSHFNLGLMWSEYRGVSFIK